VSGGQRQDDLVAPTDALDVMGRLLETFKAEMAIRSMFSTPRPSSSSKVRYARRHRRSCQTQVATASSASGRTTARSRRSRKAGKELAKTFSEISATVTQSSRLASDTVSRADTAHQTIAS